MSTDYTDLFEATLILGGVKTCTFLSDNLDGPDVDTVKRWFKNTPLNTTSITYEKLLSLLLNFIRDVRRELKKRGQ